MDIDDPTLPLSIAPASQPMTALQAGIDLPLLAGASPAIAQLRAQLGRAAPYFRTALLTGEPGCGDLEVARALHRLSPASELPFSTLTAAEAERRCTGRDKTPERPVEGMLYLPEAHRLSRAAQAGLLALLRGAGRGHLRVVAFAGQGLRPLVRAGTFSAELAGLLESLRVALPPLRERAMDIPLLFTHVAASIAEEMGLTPPKLSEDLLDMAVALPWPGNLSLMKAAVRRLLLEADCGPVLHAGNLRSALESLAQHQTIPGPRLVRLDQVAQEHIRAVLIGCGGNKLRAAEVLGISRSTLYRMLETTGFQNDLQIAG